MVFMKELGITKEEIKNHWKENKVWEHKKVKESSLIESHLINSLGFNPAGKTPTMGDKIEDKKENNTPSI